MRRDETRTSRLARVAVAAAALVSLASAGALPEAPATSVESLLRRLAAMPGFQARFEERKTIALLSVPLESRGWLYFVPPALLLRRVDEPAPALLRLDADQLLYTDADGSERLDLGANPAARAFARTFTDILAGDLPRLRKSYEIEFRPEEPEGTAWRLHLVPRDAGLARAIDAIEVTGHGLVLGELVVREASGDTTVTHFREVDPRRRFDPAEVERLQASGTP